MMNFHRIGTCTCLSSPHLDALATTGKKQFGVLPERCVGHTAGSAEMGVGIEAVEPSNSSNEPLFDLLEPQYPMPAGSPLPNTLETLPPGEGMLNLMGVTSQWHFRLG